MSSLLETIISALVGEKRRPPTTGRTWVNPLGLKRLVVDGKQYLVRDVVSVGPGEIVVVDPMGAVRTIPRGGSRGPAPIVTVKKK